MVPNLHHYWTPELFAANVSMGVHLLAALILGALVGYERTYQGRAAGMRVYGLVSMASAALTVFVGYAHLWYGGSATEAAVDPTRLVQGIVSGIGFLCGGVIIKDGFTISGLTTAASIWAVAAIGVLLGVGFYGAAVLLAVLCMLSMSLLRNVEVKLPGRAPLDVSLTFRPGTAPNLDELVAAARARGYQLMRETLTITSADQLLVWRFAAVALERSRAASPAMLAHELSTWSGVAGFAIAPARY
ncbi:MAG: MgtC/SapB family protein [Sinobacteraceae bacterium]|nr:MgtC/SapB family protein [Nevskiaceae bacterium]